MKGKYRRRNGRPRSANYTDARGITASPTGEVERKIHNDRVEAEKHDRDVNGVRCQIITFFAEDDVDPALAVEASMSVAAQIFKMPAEGMKRRGVWRFLRLAWRCFRKTQLVEAEPETAA